MTTNTSLQKAPARNGVNVEALLGARAALTESPEGARFTWRATSEWIKGTHSRSTIHGFFGLGGEQAHRQKFQFDTDHPEVFAAEDNGATPVEVVLVGLAGCLSAGIAAVAPCGTAPNAAIDTPIGPGVRSVSPPNSGQA